MSNNLEVTKPQVVDFKDYKVQFDKDTTIVAEQAANFMQAVYPAHLISDREAVLKEVISDSNTYLKAFDFYRIKSCLVGEVEDIFAYFNEKMNKFFAALRSFNSPIAYGIISENGIQNLVIGVYSVKKVPLKSIIEGLIDGAELTEIRPSFEKRTCSCEMGLVSAAPSVKIAEDKQYFDLSPLMRSINGHDYSLLFFARPVSEEDITRKYGELIQMRDQCFAVSKRNISRQNGITNTNSKTDTHTESSSTSVTKTNGCNFGLAFILCAGYNHSKSKTESSSVSDSYSKSFSKAISENEGISSEVQNGYALELIEYIDKAIERMRIGRNNGMWETAVSYSAPEKYIADIIRSHILGEFSKPDPDMLPPTGMQFPMEANEQPDSSILIPKIIGTTDISKITTLVTSDELGMMCSIPALSVPNFEMKKGRMYSISSTEGEVRIGKVCAAYTPQGNMAFNLSHEDLAKHTFVCGITGSGKTTTVKSILKNANVPFCVIESAKKEYRNMALNGEELDVYTLGKPEINCLRFNPFYIQQGVSPQMHIDYLKDLFNASFSFYGPMPYILEKCLYNVYEKKGWNLTLGYHPMLVNTKNQADFFESDYVAQKYSEKAHKYLFPTMSELKNEILRYIEQEMDYEGEVAGNIKTAILARLESLCNGPKGYMFNTNEYLDMKSVLSKQVVLELEGLSDDSDKAFCVGLLIIMINEYRQVYKETEQDDEVLNHLLVIEEAHRLLKNIDTEKNTESMGNPKGKAVEHFTNMIAEMRSYGQGVIIAEQIPTKLAPEVIKNSSNKIVQRLVAADDQKVVANTIGLPEEDAIYIGNIRPHYALCHKEGMSQPVMVLVEPTGKVITTDGELYSKTDLNDKFYYINLETAKECLDKVMPNIALKILNSLLIQGYSDFSATISSLKKNADSIIKLSGKTLLFSNDIKKIFAELVTEQIINMLHHGVYSFNKLISDNILISINDLINSPSEDKLDRAKSELSALYNGEDCKEKGKLIISYLLMREMTRDIDVDNSIRQYFEIIDDNLVDEIKAKISERREFYVSGGLGSC